MGGPPDIDAILKSRRSLEVFVDECAKSYPIDAQKFGILGFSQGGVMAYSLALADPERFRALAVLSSWLPKELVQRIEIDAAVQSLPTLVQHGTQDSTIEVDRARGSVEILRQLKVPLSYREYGMTRQLQRLSLILQLVQTVIDPLLIHQLGVATHLADLAVMQHDNSIGIADRR